MINRTAPVSEAAETGLSASHTYRIRSTVLTGQYTAVMRGEIRRGEFAPWLAVAFGTVYEYARHNGVPLAGPPFARYTFIGDVVAVEAGFPIAWGIPGDGRVEPSRLPEGTAAVTTHMGRYEHLDRACEAVNRWLAENGYQAAGPHWEVYYTDPSAEPDPRRWRTDLVVPYRVIVTEPGTAATHQ